MNGSRLSTLGLCRRAGKLVMGFDAVTGELKKPDTAVRGVLTAGGVSEKTKKEVRFFCERAGVACTDIPETPDDIKGVLGKRVGVIAVLDEGLYSSVIK